ncbi:MAG: choice-of-anchor D domain-containing protein [Bacteroidetes bacterium]|nr:choice-of-anchor D domain-containing protein [Bacteroidota bacterium]
MKSYFSRLILILLLAAIASFHVAAQAPVISIYPDNLQATLSSCNDSAAQTLLITNNGTEPLFFSIPQISNFYDGFEDGMGKWQTTGVWGPANTAYDGNYSISESPSGNYNDNWNTYCTLKDSLVIADRDSAGISFYLRYTLECNFDYLHVQISVNNGSWTTIQSFNCPATDWILNQKSLTPYVNAGDYIKVRFYFHSDVSATYDGVNIDEVRISGIGNVNNWIYFPVTEGIVNPGETTNVDIVFYSTKINTGTYLFPIRVLTNDPLNPTVIIPSTLILNGYPILTMTETTHDFGSIFENAVRVDTIWVYNQGCDTLVIQNIQTDDSQFSVFQTFASIMPGKDIGIPIEFRPSGTGSITSGLFFSCNDADIDPEIPVITLTGEGTPAPTLSLSQAAISENVPCGDSLTTSVVIRNNGLSPLEFSFTSLNSEGLILYYKMDGNATDFSQYGRHGTIYGAVPTADKQGTEGKALWFDGSNDYVDVPDGVYFTGDFTVSGWIKEPSYRNWSRLFDFGNGSSSDNVLGIISRGTSGQYAAEVYNISTSGGQIYNTNPLPLNEWVLMTQVLQGSTMKVYKNGVLWKTATTSQLPRNLLRTNNYIARSNWPYDEYFQGALDDFRIYNRALSDQEVAGFYTTELNTWLTLSPGTGTIQPGDSVVINILFNAAGFKAGLLHTEIQLTTNDPLNQTLTIPVDMTVTGTPQISLSTNDLNFSSTMQHVPVSQSFEIRNLGCDTLHVSSMDFSLPEFRVTEVSFPLLIPPVASQLVNIQFFPSDTGVYNGQFTIYSDDSPVQITLEGISTGAPIFRFEPDIAFGQVIGCNEAVEVFGTLTNDGLSTLQWMANNQNNGGSALSFDNYGEWVEVGDAGSMPEQGTIEFWLWSNVWQNYNNCFCTNGISYNNVGIRFEENSSGLFGVVVGNDYGNFFGFTISPGLPLNSWHHVAVSWDKATNQVWTYFDGSVITDGAYCDTWATSWTRIMMGVGWVDWRWWNGMMDEVRIWDTRRSNEEILQNMNKPLMGFEPGMFAYWNFNEGSGNVVNDITGHNHNGSFSNAEWVGSTIPISSFASIFPDNGSLEAGESQDFVFTLNSQGYNSGTYETGLLLYSNDPLNLKVNHPCIMQVLGQPGITSSPAEFHFGDVMAGATATQPITFKNTGCDTLFFDHAEYNNTDQFFVEPFPERILPYDSMMVNIRFSPQYVSYFDDWVTFYTNTDPYSIYIEGNGTEPPVISVDPGSLSAIVTCNESVTFPVTIYNNGWADLIVHTSLQGEGGGSPIPASCTPQTIFYCCEKGIHQVIFNTINNSTAGGSDGYQDYSATSQTIVLPGSTYQLTVVTGQYYDENVAAWIDYNADGFFQTDEKVFESYYQSGTEHTGTITIPFNAATNIPLRMRIGSDENNGSTIEPCTDVYSGQFEDYTVFINGGVNAPEVNETIAPFSSFTFDVTLTGEHLSVGVYNSNIAIASNDPSNPLLTIPCQLFVEGTASVSLSDNYHNFGQAVQYIDHTYPVTIENTGCDVLEIYSVWSANDAFYAVPDTSLIGLESSTTLMIHFYSQYTGYYSGSIWLYTNVGDYEIFVEGEISEAPSIYVEPDVLNVSLGCGEAAEVPIYVYDNAGGILHYSIDTSQSLSNGLMAWYPFSGNTNDMSDHGRNLINNGAYETEGHPGSYSQGYHFENESFMIYDNNQDIQDNLYNPQATLSLWVKIPEYSSWQNNSPCLFQIGTDNYDFGGISLTADSNFIGLNLFDYYSSAYIYCPIAYDVWMFLSFSYDGNTLKSYVNGNLNSQIDVSGEILYSQPTLSIGRVDVSDIDPRYFTGDLDDISLYNRALTSDEIQQLYENNYFLDMHTDPVTDSIGPYDWHQVMVTIQTDNLNAGFYQDVLRFLSDDPLQPMVYMPVNLEIYGNPQMIVSPDCLEFDTIMQYSSQTLDILIENPGCTYLFVSDIYTNTASFYPEFPNVVMPPHSSNLVPVIFSPDYQGTLEDTLFINGDAGPASICLRGYGAKVPVAGINPTSFNQVLSCQEDTTLSLEISNLGLAELGYQVISPSTAWFSGMNQTGVVDAMGSIMLSFTLNRQGLTPGLYNTTINVTTTDPTNASLQLPVYLLIPNPLVPVYLGVDTGYCMGSFLVLDAGNFATYRWSDGSTGSTLQVSTPGTYYVDVFDQYHCPSTDTIVITEFGIPVALAGNDTVVCEGTPVYLQGSADNTLPSFPMEVVVGQGTQFTYNTGPNPFGTYYMDHRAAYLYKKSELIQSGLRSGNLTSIGFVIGSVGYPGMNNLHIKLKTTTANSITALVNGMTEVFSTSYYYPHTGQNVFILNTPFFWNGNSNLIVEVCFDNGSWSSNSSYQFTYADGCVIGGYCDNCAPGCGMPSSGYYTERPNLIIHGDGDLTRFLWTGPGGFSSELKNTVIPSASLQNGGVYTLRVDNGYGCQATDEMDVQVQPKPVVEAGTDGNILGGEAFTFNSAITGGTAPYSHYWTPHTYLDDSLLLQPTATPVFTTTYTLHVTGSNGCRGSDGVTIHVTPRFSLSGHVTYQNSLFSALGGVWVILKNQGGTKIDSALTNQDGNYLFQYLFEGQYGIEARTSQIPGSINATDALKIGKHVVLMEQLTGFPLKAADVNSSNTVTGADALLVLHHTVGNISTFPAGDWYFEPSTFLLSGADKVRDFSGIAFGDVNTSYIPGMKGQQLDWELSGTVAASQNETFLLSVSLKEGNTLGAATLDILVPRDYLVTENVSVATGTCVFRTAGDILHIAWSSSEPLPLGPGEGFITLKLRRTSASPPGIIRLSIVGSGELADASARVISGETLQLPVILPSENTSAGFWLGQNYPNPVSGITEIPYSLPEDGTVTIEILNVLGERLMKMDEGVKKQGINSLTFNVKSLPAGLCLYRLSFNSKSGHVMQTRSMIISK